jgi:hypothetical protein
VTTMKTENLIHALAADTRNPLRRLSSPAVRVGFWLCVSLPWIAIVVAFMGLRPDLGIKVGEPRWLLEQGAALMTAMTAAMAAFCAGVPGRPRWERAVPLAPLALWIGLLGAGCLRDWRLAGPQGLALDVDWACVPGIVTVGLVPGIAMAIMLRRGAPLAPVLSVGLGGLAAAALADFGLRLFHPQDASLMVLVWQVGTVAALTALSAAAGRRLVAWRHLAAR